LVYPVNASEFIALTDEERMRMSEVVVDQNRGRLPVMIGVAGVSREAAAVFSRHARKIGADAVIAMPPYLSRGALPEEVIFDYYREIAESGGLQVCVQNYVPPIGTDMSARVLMRLCREIPEVCYIKEETVPSTVKLSQLETENDGSCKGVFGGSGGRFLIEEHLRGSAGNMPGCHVTDVVVAFWKALESGESARALHIYKELSPLFFFEQPMPGLYKEVLKRRGVISCAGRRNGKTVLDALGSNYLDRLLDDLEPLMRWRTWPGNGGKGETR